MRARIAWHAQEVTEGQLLRWIDYNAPVCGCGNPTAALSLIRDVITFLGTDYDERPNRNLIEELLPDDGARYLVLGWMDQAGLIEHGTSIDYPWLTDRGRDLYDGFTFARDLEELLESRDDLYEDFGNGYHELPPLDDALWGEGGEQ